MAHRRQPSTACSLRHRRGSLTVEMLLVVVVLAIMTVGIAQFGVFFANADEVALAARVGALEASQTPALPTTSGAPVPANVVQAIEQQLYSSGIAWCVIRLEHNVGPVTVLESEVAPNTFVCAPKTELPSAPGAATAPTQYVRLTVCVPLNQLIPKQLSYFGVQVFSPDKTYEHTTTMRYELTPP